MPIRLRQLPVSRGRTDRHRRCREILIKAGPESLRQAKAQTPALAPVQLRVPRLVFDSEVIVRLGEKTIQIMHAPGHSPDSVMVHIHEDKVLVASDILTPVPLIVRGSPEELAHSLKRIKTLNLENAVQGHGGVLLRGEIDETVDKANDAQKQLSAGVKIGGQGRRAPL
jgi:glyoxylase-like metal-dependent hydrolase (beta-lactamase superfamily II)